MVLGFGTAGCVLDEASDFDIDEAYVHQVDVEDPGDPSFDDELDYDADAVRDDVVVFDEDAEDDGFLAGASVSYPTGNANLGIVTLNVGPDDPTSDYSNLKGGLASTDRILVLQEVQNLSGMRSELSADFPFEYVTENYTDRIWNWGCFCRERKRNNVVVLSKLPIVHQESSLIQTDPGGDKWRRHAQFVEIKYANDANVRLFHYHNTYNWHNNSSQYEKSGMQSFKTWVESKVGTLSTSTDKVFMAGDFNLSKSSVDDILGTSLHYQSDWVDHVVSTSQTLAAGGVVDASAISDHDLVWAEWNLTSNIDTAERNVARLYEHSNFGGAVVAFERGNYGWIDDERSGWNDKVSSIRVGGDVRLHAWEHAWYGGTKWCLPTESGCGISSYNDKFSSLKVLSR